MDDAFKVLKKLDDECVDMVFIGPPYFLQLPNKELRRWEVKTVVEGVGEKPPTPKEEYEKENVLFLEDADLCKKLFDKIKIMGNTIKK